MDDTLLESTQALAVVSSDPPQSLAPAPTPDVLGGRYRLGAIVGRGGVGQVHLARDLVLDRDVAVKVFRTDTALPEEARRYEQEARLLAALNHPNLVTVFDAGLGAGAAGPYLVMELVRGETLRSFCASGPMHAADVARVGSQIAAALAYVHRQGVIHRDVKPANVLLARTDESPLPVVKLTDFGIARMVDGDRMTVDGTAVGTPNYLSPEQATGEHIGTASDVYSLGLVLLECLTGQTVYPGYGVEAAVVRLHRPPRPPRWLSAEWRALITAMTARDPDVRPTAADVASYLAALAEGAAPAALQGAPSEATDGRPSEPIAPVPDAALPAADTTVLPRLPGEALSSVPVPLAAAASVAVPLPDTRRPRRRRTALFVAAAVALAGAVVMGVALAGQPTPSVAGPAAAQYPAVAGQLGSDLTLLQQRVAAVPVAALRPQLQDDTVMLTRDSAGRQWVAAQHALTALRSHLAAAIAAGTARGADLSGVGAAADRVAADLARLVAPSPAQTSTPARPVTPVADRATNAAARPSSAANAPTPAAPKPAGGKGHGHGKRGG